MIANPVRQHFDFPPGFSTAREIPKPVRDAAAEFVRLRDEHRQARRALATAETELRELESVEVQAAADARRASKSAPDSAVPAKRAEIDAKRREIDVLDRAIRDSFQAFAGTLRKHRDQISERLAESERAAQQAEREALDALERTHEQRRLLAVTRAWTSEFPTRYKVATPGGFGLLHALASPNGTVYRVPEALDALRAYADGTSAPIVAGPFAPGQDQRTWHTNKPGADLAPSEGLFIDGVPVFMPAAAEAA